MACSLGIAPTMGRMALLRDITIERVFAQKRKLESSCIKILMLDPLTSDSRANEKSQARDTHARLLLTSGKEQRRCMPTFAMPSEADTGA